MKVINLNLHFCRLYFQLFLYFWIENKTNLWFYLWLAANSTCGLKWWISRFTLNSLKKQKRKVKKSSSVLMWTVLNVIYLASNCVIVNWFTEQDVFCLEEVFASAKSLSLKKPGCFGWGNAPSPQSIRTTDDMLGLSFVLHCTHKRPTWIERSTSDKLYDSATDSGISSKCLPSWNSLHAWEWKSSYW